MESKLMLGLLVAVAVVSSGCTSQLPFDTGQASDTQEPRQVPGKGLEVTSFRITDNTLSPGQQAEVTLRMKNYHQEEVTMGDITLYNVHPLEKQKNGCNPDEIEPAGNGVYPVMECTWTVTAPSSSEIGAFSQRKTSFSANIPYESSMVNFQPLKIEFKPFGSINNTRKKIMSYANGEVKVELQTESPAALNQNKTLGVRVSKAGSGRIDGNFTFEYSPESIFTGACPDEKKPILENTVEFSCPMRLDGSQSSVRNVFLTVHYKYVQAPSMDVTIVKTQ